MVSIQPGGTVVHDNPNPRSDAQQLIIQGSTNNLKLKMLDSVCIHGSRRTKRSVSLACFCS